MYGIFHIRPVSVGLDSQIWYLFIYITGYLNVRKMSETIDFRTFVGPLISWKLICKFSDWEWATQNWLSPKLKRWLVICRGLLTLISTAAVEASSEGAVRSSTTLDGKLARWGWGEEDQMEPCQTGRVKKMCAKVHTNLTSVPQLLLNKNIIYWTQINKKNRLT